MKKFVLGLVLALIFTFIVVTAVAAAPIVTVIYQQLGPAQVAEILLGLVGMALQLIFRYAPKASDWYQAQTNKGLWMLLFVVIAGAVYFGLSCTPLAGEFGIGVSCTVPDLFVVLKALFVLAASQSLTYLYTKPSSS
jgi:hypothetical protein